MPENILNPIFPEQMIFLGDIASPDKSTTEQLEKFFNRNSAIFKDKRLICNFEGLVSDEAHFVKKHPVLFNYPSVPHVLNRGIAPVLCLANNHTLDLPLEFDSTVNIFKNEGVPFCGAGKSKEEAAMPITFDESNRQFLLFNACWDFLLYNQRNPSKGVYVAEINETRLIGEVSKQKKLNAERVIIVFLHWSFDLETLPFPMYRQFSRSLIDSGASLVVGTHSHCIQGGEIYKDGYIVYGLGNFFLPYKTFANNNLTFPDFARLQLALDWDFDKNEVVCHWFEYNNKDNNHSLEYMGSEKFEESETMSKYSPFGNLSDAEYMTYYRKYRRKKILIPVYSNYESLTLNEMYTYFLKFRAYIGHSLAKLKLRKWQN